MGSVGCTQLLDGMAVMNGLCSCLTSFAVATLYTSTLRCMLPTSTPSPAEVHTARNGRTQRPVLLLCGMDTTGDRSVAPSHSRTVLSKDVETMRRLPSGAKYADWHAFLWLADATARPGFNFRRSQRATAPDEHDVVNRDGSPVVVGSTCTVFSCTSLAAQQQQKQKQRHKRAATVQTVLVPCTRRSPCGLAGRRLQPHGVPNGYQ